MEFLNEWLAPGTAFTLVIVASVTAAFTRIELLSKSYRLRKRLKEEVELHDKLEDALLKPELQRVIARDTITYLKLRNSPVAVGEYLKTLYWLALPLGFLTLTVLIGLIIQSANTDPSVFNAWNATIAVLLEALQSPLFYVTLLTALIFGVSKVVTLKRQPYPGDMRKALARVRDLNTEAKRDTARSKLDSKTSKPEQDLDKKSTLSTGTTTEEIK